MNTVSVQDIFQQFYEDYCRKYTVTAVQRKAAWCIMNCKTGALGVNVSVCEDCGCISLHFNSCKNRCCPMCQELPTQKWIDAQKENVLDAPYFHMVFTLPEELNPIIYSNQKLLYDALYQSASETLNELSSDSRHLGARIGYTCILHTWGSAMNYHPHLHCIVLGGGLDVQNRWKEKGADFFLPVQVITRKFRGKYMERLKLLWKENKLKFHGLALEYRNHYRFQELLNQCFHKQWIPYIKKTFNGAQSVIDYLGRYTHRIAISNQRILHMDSETVTYLVKDYAQGGGWKRNTVSGIEFIRRFLMHIPPKRFVRIRHYGLLSSRVKKLKMTLCRNLLGCKKYISILKTMDMPHILKHLYGTDICICKECGGKLLHKKGSSQFIRAGT